MKPFDAEFLRRLLCDLQNTLVNALLERRVGQSVDRLSAVAAVTTADTIYQIDIISEEIILSWFERHWPAALPVELVMEGLEEAGQVTFPAGTAVENTVLKVIIDPIDGTRNIMYDKRSAWILSGIAAQKGSETHLGDIFVAAMTEIPVRKQAQIDQLSAVRGGSLHAVGRQYPDEKIFGLKLAPSRLDHLRHGFASVVKFFPEGKELLLEVEQRLFAGLLGAGPHQSPLVFDDQYISTGGQFYEILAGHDRFIADLRPLAFRRMGMVSALVCHPYDACCALLLEAAGCVIEDAEGRPLCVPLDTTSPVDWVAYANAELAAKVRPVLHRVIAEVLG